MRAEYWWRVRRAAAGPRPPVLVYQMAKGASTTVVDALKRVGGLHVLQVHVINPESIRRLHSSLRERRLTVTQMDVDLLGRAVFRGIIEAGRGARVVSLVREPISRNISFYFHNLDVLWQTADAHEKIGLDRLLEGFYDKFNHDRALNWFDDEFKPVLGVDIYEHEFPHALGHLRLDAGRYEILLMRVDLEDAAKAKCLAAFVGAQSVTLVPKNAASQKPYADTYREFLRAIRLPESYVDHMLTSKYARHFFSPEELAALRSKWLRQSAGESDAGEDRSVPARRQELSRRV